MHPTLAEINLAAATHRLGLMCGAAARQRFIELSGVTVDQLETMDTGRLQRFDFLIGTMYHVLPEHRHETYIKLLADDFRKMAEDGWFRWTNAQLNRAEFHRLCSQSTAAAWLGDYLRST